MAVFERIDLAGAGLLRAVTGTGSELQAVSFENQVAARAAWPGYQRRAAYICQPSRAFRAGLKYFGFYAEVVSSLILLGRTRRLDSSQGLPGACCGRDPGSIFGP